MDLGQMSNILKYSCIYSFQIVTASSSNPDSFYFWVRCCSVDVLLFTWVELLGECEVIDELRRWKWTTKRIHGGISVPCTLSALSLFLLFLRDAICQNQGCHIQQWNLACRSPRGSSCFSIWRCSAFTAMPDKSGDIHCTCYHIE